MHVTYIAFQGHYGTMAPAHMGPIMECVYGELFGRRRHYLKITLLQDYLKHTFLFYKTVSFPFTFDVILLMFVIASEMLENTSIYTYMNHLI